jgi:(1->4)-alpha-D-glucan 1-alpha-D-glucosylmutase
LLIQRVLAFRNAHRELFDDGEYIPLEVRGAQREHVCVFARRRKNDATLVIAPRLVWTLLGGRELHPMGKAVWGDTEILLCNEIFVDAITRSEFPRLRGGRRSRTEAADRTSARQASVKSTRLPNTWRNVLTRETFAATTTLRVHEVLRTFPVALLTPA